MKTKIKQIKVKDLMPGDFFYFCDESFFYKNKSESGHMDGYKLLKYDHVTTGMKAGVEYQILYVMGVRWGAEEELSYPRLESIEIPSKTLVFLEENEGPEDDYFFIQMWHSYLIRELGKSGLHTSQMSLLVQSIHLLSNLIELYEEELDEDDL